MDKKNKEINLEKVLNLVESELSEKNSRLVKNALLDLKQERDLAQERCKDTFTGSSTGLVYLNKKGKIIEYNQAFKEMTELEDDDIKNKTTINLARRFLKSNNLAKVLRNIKVMVSGKAVRPYSVEFVTPKTKTKKYLEIGVLSSKGKKGITAYFNDATEKKELQHLILNELEEKKALEKELIKEARINRTLFEQAPIGYIVYDRFGTIYEANLAARQMTGYGDELIGKNFIRKRLLSIPDAALAKFRMLKKKVGVFDGPYEYTVRRSDKTKFPIEIMTQLVEWEGKKRILGVFRDITERKKLKDTLKNVFDISENLLVILNKKGNIVRLNKAGYKDLGYRNGTLKGKHWIKYIVPEEIKKEVNEVFKQCISGKIEPVKEYENPVLTKRKKQLDYYWHNTYLKNHQGEIEFILSAGTNITQFKKIIKDLDVSVKEKEILLAEVHHRTKNSLQVTSSSLSLQLNELANADSTELKIPYHKLEEVMTNINLKLRKEKDLKIDKKLIDKSLKELNIEPKMSISLNDAKEAFYDNLSRISAMSDIHRCIYSQNNFSGVKMAEYIPKLTHTIHDSYLVHKNKTIKLNNKVEKDIELPIKDATNLGLIVNEAITNSIKYAFKDKNKGKINIKMYKKDQDYYLIISDNGVGFPKEKLENNSGLGMKLLNILPQQLGGTLLIKTKQGSGTEYIIKFPYKNAK